MWKLKKWKIIILCLFQLMTSALATINEESVGFYCANNQECEYYRAENVYSKCVANSCHCYNNNTQAVTKCRPRLNILRKNNIVGGICPCSIPHAICNQSDSLCYCEINYIPSNDKRRCIPGEVPLGESCEMDKQCLASHVFSDCDNDTKMCICMDGFHQQNSTCFPQTNIKPKCTDDAQCQSYGPNMICLPNIFECVCKLRYVKSNNSEECIPERHYMEECQDTLQCYAIMGQGAICQKDICRCDEEGFVLVKQNNTEEMICKPLVLIGQYCRTHEDCNIEQTTEDQQLMECNHGECVCRFGINNKPPCSLSMSTSLSVRRMSLWFILIGLGISIFAERGFY